MDYNLDKKTDNGIKQLLFKYLPFWPLFGITMLVSGVFFYIQYKQTTPIFETTASVLIKDEKKGEEESKMEEVLNVFGSKKIVENEQEILRSNSIIDDVVSHMNLNAEIFRENKWPGLDNEPAYLLCPLILEAKDPNTLKNSEKIYFSISADNNVITLDDSSVKVNQWIHLPEGVVRFVPNPHFKPDSDPDSEDFSYFFRLYNVKKKSSDLISRLIVTPSNKQSSVINITLKDAAPKRAEAVIENIIRTYNRYSVDRKNSVARQTLEFIEERLNKVSKELDSVESGIQRYRNQSGIVNIGEQSRQYLESMENNDKEINKMNIQLSALEQVEKYLINNDGEGTIAPSTFNIQDVTLNKLLEKYYTSVTQYENMKRTNGENFPAVEALREEINKSKPSILENIQNQRNSIEAGRSYLTKNTTKYSYLLNAIPKKEKDLVEVSRQQNIKNDIYSFLLQKKEEISYSISSILPDCYIVSNPTTSEYPISPKKPLLIILAVFLPILLSVIILLIKDTFNHKILFRSDIEKYTDYPIMGELVYERFKNPIVTAAGERRFIIEQFRQIRSVLKHQGTPPGSLKRILITSSIKGDGKSFVSANLAMSYARSGKKVALLEFDLHQPKTSEMFGIPPTIGITEFLAGSARPENIILNSKKDKNLYILPAGYPEDDASELIGNGRVEQLLNHLDKQFDLIIIDTAPFKALTDAFTIAAHCNLVLVVVRHNHTPNKILERIHDDMDAHSISNVGIIFNGVKNRGMGKYSYGYGYGYGYDQKSNYNEYFSDKILKVS